MNKVKEACMSLIKAPPYDYQEKIITAVLKGRNVFGVLPTGGGKSLCYQVPAFVRKRKTVLVFSPLISLMQDQVTKCKSMGLKAARISHDMDSSLIKQIYRNVNTFDILYVAPERLKSSLFVERMSSARLALIALDEFHEHNKASMDFRPSYKLVSSFLEKLSTVPVLALTATADEDVELEFKSSLGKRKYKRVVASPIRDNLTYVITHNNPLQNTASIIAPVEDAKDSSIVYCSTRKRCDDLGLLLRERYGISTGVYHGGVPMPLRNETQERWMNGELSCVVATNAFGMGVDKPNVRVVYHHDEPGSVFQYVQESGRAGRDGNDSVCYLNLSEEGLRTQRYFISMQNPPFSVYENLWGFFMLKKRAFSVNVATLEQVTGVSKRMQGCLMSALCFMEYNHLITVTPKATIYELPIKNRSLCATFAEQFSYVRMRGDTCTVKVNAGMIDPVSDMLRVDAVGFRFPLRRIIIRRRKRDLSITNDMVVNKMQKALARLAEVRAFASAANKHEFIDSVFLQRERRKKLL